MTSAEYSSLYAQLKRKYPGLTQKAMAVIRKAMAEAGRKVADILREGTLDGSGLSWETQRQIDQSLLESSQDIADSMRTSIPELLATAGGLSVAVEVAFLSEAMAKVSKVSLEGLQKLFEKTMGQAVQSSLNFVGPDGFSLWGRIPNVSSQFGDDIVNLVRAAIDQGRDLGKIAADVNKYIKDGKASTIHRWGENIKPDSARLLRRVPERVDYRALRLARSELGRGLMETAKANGQANPGATGWYDWVRLNSIDWGCECPNNQANSPYLLADFPAYSHPNCSCTCRAVLKDGAEFREDLKAWANGESSPDLESWYQSTYLPAQF